MITPEIEQHIFRLNNWPRTQQGKADRSLGLQGWAKALESANSDILLTVLKLSKNMKQAWEQYLKVTSQPASRTPPFPFDDNGHSVAPLYEEKDLNDFDKALRTILNYGKDKAT